MEIEYKGSTGDKDTMLLVGNLVCATDHLLENIISKPEQKKELLPVAYMLDKTRTEIMKKLNLPEEQWCLFKHLATARVIAQEVFKTGANETYIQSITEILVALFGEEYDTCGACKKDKGDINDRQTETIQ